MQNRERSFGQTKVTGNGELEPFGDTVLHLEDGSGGGVGNGRFFTSNSVVVVPSVSIMAYVPAGAGGGRATAPRRAGEAEEGHLLKGAVPKVSRLVEKGTQEGAIMHKGMFPSTFHVRASHEGGCRVLSNPP